MAIVTQVGITDGVPTSGTGEVSTLNDIAKAEDVASAGGDLGFPAYAVRQDTPANSSGTDGDYEPMKVSGGRLWVDASGKTLTVNASGNAVPVTDNSGSLTVDNAGTFAVQAAQSGSWTVDASGTPVPITDNSGSITVDAPVGTPAFVRLSDGSSAISTLPVSLASVPSHAVTNAGTFAVQVDGNALTSLQLIDDVVFAEDAASANGDKGVQVLTKRTDTAAASSGTDGDYQPLITDSSGRLHVNVGNTVTVGSHAVTNAGTFAVQVDGSALTSLELIDDSVVTLGTTTYTEATSKGLAIGAVRRDADTTLVNTTNEYGPLQMDANGRLKVEAFSGETLPVSLASVPSHAVTNAGTFAVQASGDVAHDSADSGSPTKVGGVARSSEATAVANADRVNAVFDLVGKQIVLPYANPENFVSGAITSAMTGTTSTSLVAAPGAGLRNYITTIICSNSHATVGTDIAIQDGSGGTTLLTIPAAAVYGGSVITLPVPLRQPTANTALYCANVTTGASTKVSAVGYKGA